MNGNMMNGNRVTSLLAAGMLLAAALNPPAHAFRMLQNKTVGTVTSGALVKCDDPDGFAHWTIRQIDWNLDPANEGATAGSGVDHGINEWNGVSGSDYVLSRVSANTAGFTVDGVNTMVWAAGNGCVYPCLALTSQTLVTGQVIIESDITFNTSENWTTSNSNFDIRAVATHELGHSLGIHHSEKFVIANRPTMRPKYFDNARSLEDDDKDALRCSVDKFPFGCVNPCPSGGVFDGANCYIGSVPGNEPFIYNGAFYHKPVEHPAGPCPHLVWDMLNNVSIQPFFDGANCYIASAGGGPNPFILNGNYYISKSSGSNPCPFGGTYDGANCYMFTWPGVTPFVYQNSMYYKPVWHPTSHCPHAVPNLLNNTSITPTFDTANCLVKGNPGSNQSAFILGNKYYLTKVCP